jgi:hypothetical protein
VYNMYGTGPVEAVSVQYVSYVWWAVQCTVDGMYSVWWAFTGYVEHGTEPGGPVQCIMYGTEADGAVQPTV